MKTIAYYVAIVVLLLFVGVVVFRLLFGTPCTIVGNYCVGDGWTIAGLAGTILGVSAAILGILGAFAVAAWWTGLDDRVSKQVDSILKKQEENLSKRIDEIVYRQEGKVDGLDKSIQLLSEDIESLRKEYSNVMKMAEDARKISIDAATFGRPWNIEPLALNAIHEYHMVDVAVKMVHKYLEYVDGFLSRSGGGTGQYMSSLKESGAPSASFQYFWDAALRWRDEVNSFSVEHPEIVKQINDQIESYRQRLDKLKQA